MNLNEAKKILNKYGYQVVNESRGFTYTPQDIFDELWDRSYSYWDDGDYNDFRLIFINGYKNLELPADLAAKYNTSIKTADIVYEDGIEFAKCTTDDCVQNKLADKTVDEYYY